MSFFLLFYFSELTCAGGSLAIGEIDGYRFSKVMLTKKCGILTFYIGKVHKYVKIPHFTLYGYT